MTCFSWLVSLCLLPPKSSVSLREGGEEEEEEGREGNQREQAMCHMRGLRSVDICTGNNRMQSLHVTHANL